MVDAMSLSQYILDAREQYRMQIRERSTLLTRVRWYNLIILATVATITSGLANDNPRRNLKFVLVLGGIGLALNMLLWALTKLKRQKISFYQTVSIAQILLDTSLASAIVYFQGGLSSRATIVYAIPIVGAGLLFSKVFAYATALLCAIAYASTLFIYQIYHPAAFEQRAITLPAVFYAAVFIIIAVIIAAYRERTEANEREQTYAGLLSLLRHQLYHPTGVIAALIDMLEHGQHYPHWPQQDKNYLVQLKRENKRLHTMIANALEAMADNTKPTQTAVFDVIQLLNEAAVSCATGAKRISDLKTMLPNKTVNVEGNPQQLAVAFDNLIENAFHYTEKGTPVTIKVKEENLKISIFIEDSGKGISQDHQKQLFKLFSKLEDRIGDESKDQAKKLYDMGLGLYVSKLIIERHHGKLKLVSDKNGTKIIVTLYGRII